MLVRSGKLADTMSRYLIWRIEENPAIELHYNTEVASVDGDGHLERISWRDGDSEQIVPHDIRHLFVMTGASPRTGWLEGCLALDNKGFVLTGHDLDRATLQEKAWPLSRPPQLLETSLPGVFAVGDIRAGNVSAWRRPSAKDRSRFTSCIRCWRRCRRSLEFELEGGAPRACPFATSKTIRRLERRFGERRFAFLQCGPILPADGMALAFPSPFIPVCRERVVSIQRQSEPAACLFPNQTKLLLSRSLAPYVAFGDEITFPIPEPDAAGPEILVTKNAAAGLNRYIYQAPIGYVSQPKQDKRNQSFVSAEVHQGGLGIGMIFLPCGVLREYFYRLPTTADRVDHPTLYEVLRISASASPSELRVAFKLRDLELKSAGVSHGQRVALERAFNIVGQPELRACYDVLLADPEAPAVFPYGGFGSLLVDGEPSRDGQTFFARRILAFSPDLRRRRFHVPLRKCDFYDDRALCRDMRRKLEVWLDPAALHTLWDRTWNQWKHLLGTKIEVEGTFVQSGKYRKRRGKWELFTRETALPSRLQVKLPLDFQLQMDSAITTYHRFGQYSRALDQIRLLLEHRAVERADLRRMCSELRIPADFDVAQISWRPDYDPFFYRQLSRRARRIYLFRDEYIFDVEKAVVVETPELGHATYVFAKPRSMDSFLALYTKIRKDDVRRNRNNTAERLGFLGRVIHGTNPRAWLKEVRQRVGEKIDVAGAIP
jgi:hypothetical protein